MDISHLSIGKNIMHYRKRKGISLNELSKRSGVSKSMLSQIEQEKTNPTVITIWKISQVLDTSLEDLVEAESDFPIGDLRSTQVPLFYSDDQSCVIQVNSPMHMKDDLELYTLSFKPKGELHSQPHYPKTTEFLTVISGEVKVIAGEFEATLKEGDTARYRADRDHSIINLKDNETTAYLVVIFP
jgi:transcriptional regulator with XRE-family HTH domain